MFVFVIAAVTDLRDVHIARKHGLITNFGKLMDPLADKVLMCAGFVLLTELGLIPAWIVILILTIWSGVSYVWKSRKLLADC